LRDFAKEFRRDVKGFTAEAEQALVNQPWPGNVRQLRNCIERAVALSQAPRIGVDALFPAEASDADEPPLATLAEVRDRAERQHIRAVLADVENRIDKMRRRWRPPGQGSPLAPAPMAPDPVRPKPRSGGAAAPVEITEESPPDVVARRTVSPGKTRDLSEQRRLASRR
jgi:hypothetical protein